MNATVTVTRPCKEVPIVVVPNGTIANDKAIASYELDFDKVTLYAEQSVLDGISELPITIPASTLTSDREISMPLIPPYGVTKISESVVNINIKLAQQKQRVIKDVKIEFSNVPEGFDVSFIDENATTEVTLKGAEKVIEKMKAEDIEVKVDLSQIEGSGDYTLPIQVQGQNHLVTYMLKNAETTIRAVKK
jgi:YbbR domain-containing protein